MNTLDKKRLLNDLKDLESRRLFYAEHISTGLPFQIRELRKKRGLTQKQVAELTGKKQSNISDFENPNYEYTPQIGTLMQLADAFDVPLIVRFGSWEEVWDWEMNLSPRKLAPQAFQDALPKLEKKVAKSRSVVTNAPNRTLTRDDDQLYLFPVDMPLDMPPDISEWKILKQRLTLATSQTDIAPVTGVAA